MQLDYSLVLDGKTIRFKIFSQEKLKHAYSLFQTNWTTVNVIEVPGVYTGEISLRGDDSEADNIEVCKTFTRKSDAIEEFDYIRETLRLFLLWKRGKKNWASSNVLD